MKVVGKLRSDQEKLFLYYHLGRCQESLGHKEKALIWYRKMSYYKKSFSLLKMSLQDQKFLPANPLFQVDLADMEQKLQ